MPQHSRPSGPYPVSGAGGFGDSGWKRLGRTGRVIGVAVVVGAIIAAVTLWATLRNESAERERAQEPAGPTATNGAASASAPQARVEARIEKTWDVDSGRFVGVQSYLDPADKGRGAAGQFLEGNTITVLCYRDDGPEVKDKPWRDRPLSSRVWYKIEKPPGHWISGLYVVFPPSGARPADLPVCT